MGQEPAVRAVTIPRPRDAALTGCGYIPGRVSSGQHLVPPLYTVTSNRVTF